MDEDRVTEAANQVRGLVKEAIGKLTGDIKIEAKGAPEKRAGNVQNAVGGTKDSVHHAMKRGAGRTPSEACRRKGLAADCLEGSPVRTPEFKPSRIATHPLNPRRQGPLR